MSNLLSLHHMWCGWTSSNDYKTYFNDHLLLSVTS